MIKRILNQRTLASLLLVSSATLLVVSTIWADGITGYFRTTGPGRRVTGSMNGDSSTEWAGTLISEIDGTEVGTFCTDIEHPIHYDEAFVYEGPATCRVAWVVNNYPPLFGSSTYPDNPPTPPLSDWDDEMAARQSVIWHFADGFVLEETTSSTIRDRAQQIIDSVPDPCEVTLEMPELTITPADVSDIYPDQATQTFSVTATQGEQPVAGLTVSLSITPTSNFDLSDATVTTGEDGSASFTVTASAPGSTQIDAQASFSLPTGTMFSPVDGSGQRLVLGEPTPGLVFADATATWVSGGTIVGHVFHDRNMNGVQDQGEEGLTDWTVTLYDNGDNGGTNLEAGVTAGTAGNYLFDGVDDNGLESGTYQVSLTDREGFQRTTDASVTVELSIGGHGVANFGVVKLPVVRVCKYNDLNESGSHDEGEPWLPGWEMQLYEGDDDSQVISGHGLTDDDGCVVLGFFDESYYESTQSYYVGETLQEGWFNVSPITQTFDLGANEVEQVYFGNVAPNPEIRLEKSGPLSAHEGDSITYVFTATNQGNVKLSGAVSDPLLPDLACSFEGLAPGLSHTCQISYSVPSDTDDPMLNTATVSAEDAYGNGVEDTADHSLDVLHPALELAVTATPNVVHAGDQVTWEVTVTNSGDDPLTNVILGDDNNHDYGAPFELDVGARATFTYTTNPTADGDNAVTATGTDSLGAFVEATDSASVNVISPDIELVQTISSDTVAEGDPIHWTLTVHNRGDTPLYGVTVTDTNGHAFGPLTLAANDGDDASGADQATWTYTTYPEQTLTNTASASGTDLLNLTVSDDDSASVQVTPAGDEDPGDGGGDGDGDGTPGYGDTDSDADGIPDAVEGDGDADGDGTPNYEDSDSDGDGIPDAIEGDGDADGDGTPNFLDNDSDGDNIPDVIEGDGDADGDGTPNFLDLDSDGDTIPDAVEGAEDADGDGTPNFLDLDSDGDSIPDAVEGAEDADGDGTPNFLDLDSDGDDIPDAVEGDADADGDGTPNFLDLDSDDDGIPDSVEAGDDAQTPIDSDDDGTPDYLDLDSDGDGIPDAGEWSEGSEDPLASCDADDAICFDNDADGDGIPNYLDSDSDGDGIPDSEEGLEDNDEDGIPDWLDPSPTPGETRHYLYLPLIGNW